MPHQNLDSEIMMAAAIWLLALCVFIVMLVIVFATVLSERRTKPKVDFQTIENPASQSQENISPTDAELDSPVWEQT